MVRMTTGGSGWSRLLLLKCLLLGGAYCMHIGTSVQAAAAAVEPAIDVSVAQDGGVMKTILEEAPEGAE
eukprot:scaffold260088_cov37-Attheya_sp.AAC.1